MLLTLAFFIIPAFWPQKALEANIRRPWSKAWRSGGSAHLPPMWPGFKSRCRRHMWVEFVVGSLLCSERFFSGYSSFPLSSKTNISKFQFDKESSRRRTILWMYYLQIIILFIYYFLWYETELAQNNAPKTLIFERFWSYLTLNCKECLKSDLWLWDGFGKCLLFVLSANGWMIKTWPLRFPAKENPNMEKALFDWPIVLQHDVTAMPVSVDF